MALTILIPQPLNVQQRVQTHEAPGRPGHRVAGGWMADLAALKQAITLCPFCVGKFNPKSHQYEVWRREVYVVARCDGCKQHSRNARMFIHQSQHHDVGEYAPRRRGRWAKGR